MALKPLIAGAFYQSGGGATAPGGAAGTLQFNNTGAFGGISGWSSDGANIITGAAGTTLAIGGATIGAHTLAVGGTSLLTGLLTVTQATANAGILASTGYSLTGSDVTSMIDLAGTWNTSGTPTALKLNITNTASNAASLLLDLQLSSTSVFKVRRDGRMLTGVGVGTGPFIVHSSNTEGPGFINATNIGWMDNGGNNFSAWASGGFAAASDGKLGFASATSNFLFAPDAFFMRRAAASLTMGALHATTPTAQALSAHDVTTGTGASLTLSGGRGSVAGGALILATSATTGAPATWLSIGADGIISAQGLTISPVSATNCTISSTTGNSLTLATLDGNKNVIIAPHGTGSVILGSGSASNVAIGRTATTGIYFTGGGNDEVDVAAGGTQVIRFTGAGSIAYNLIRPQDDLMASVTLGDSTHRWLQLFLGPTGIKIGDGTSGPTITASGTSPNESLVISPAGTGLLRVNTAASADAAVASTHTVRVNFNGTEYKVLLATP